jgi:hypothetical protein
VQRRGAPQDVERGPARFQDPCLPVDVALDRDVAVDEVRDEQRDGRPGHEVEGRGSPAAADREADDHRQQDQVHDGVAHRRELLEQTGARVAGKRRQEEDPRDGTDADRDDQRVDHAVPVTARVAQPDQPQDARDETWIDREVEDVADRRERQDRAEESLVVVRDDVAGHEEGLAQCEQVPGEPCLRLPDPDGDHDRDRR